MAQHRTITITLRWRTAAALVPAAVLAASGVALSHAGFSSSEGPSLPSVPAAPVTQAAAAPGASPGSTDIPPVAPALVLPKGVVPGSTAQVPLDSGPGIPAPALAAYRQAAALLDRADPGCHLDWALLGAIGRVESDHARFGGNALDSHGIARPGIIGIPLDGRAGTALIRDTDGGRWDRDRTYDRAVGPMQFIPGTWRAVGADGDGDGQRNPQSMSDAATSAGVYLCSGAGDLQQSGDLYRAIRRYNDSDSYARTVMAIANAYRHGVTALPADQLPAAQPADVASDEPAPAAVRRAGARGGSRGEGTDATDAGAQPGSSGGAGVAGSGSTDGASAGGAGGASAGGASSGTRPTASSPGQPPAPVASAGAAVTSVVSSAASLVTSVVTIPVPLKQPIVTCVTEVLKNPLGVLTQQQVCTTTSTTTTTTTTTAPAP